MDFDFPEGMIPQKMGVDFIGFSNVAIVPIPAALRPKRVPAAPVDFEAKALEMIRSGVDRKTAVDTARMSMVLAGASWDAASGRYIQPDELEELSREAVAWETDQDAHEDTIQISWLDGVIYKKTPETERASAGRSYSGYRDFLKELTGLKGSPLAFAPPDTDVAPWNGILPSHKARDCLNDIRPLREALAAASKDEWWEVEFFDRFVHALTLASESGVLIIC